MKEHFIDFHKYHGSGNDFIIIDDRSLRFPVDDSELIQHLCQRCFGIGADGLILLQQGGNTPYRMRYFNNDGKEAAMCGNGLRCLVDCIHRFVDPQKEYRIETAFQTILCFHEKDHVSLLLDRVHVIDWEMPYTAENYHLKLFIVDTTLPHAVFFKENLEFVDFIKVAKHIRSTLGVNVNLAKIDSHNHVSVRSYERGVEQETLSCGTGAAAVAYVVSNLHREDAITVMPLSKEPLHFKIGPEKQKMMMTGSANWVFSGQCRIKQNKIIGR